MIKLCSVVIFVSLIAGCVSYPRMGNVSVMGQPEPGRVMGVLAGDFNHSEDDVVKMVLGALAKNALDRGFAGFHIYDQDVQETVVSEPYTDSKGQISTLTKTKYTVKIKVLLLNEPNPDMGKYLDAASTLAGAEETQKTNGDISVAATCCGIGLGAGILIVSLAGK